ncbi:hypothetical protein Tco_0105722 [Tanacetum coccineum]
MSFGAERRRNGRVHNSVGVMEEEPDIENMKLEEYLKYEFEKKSRLWRSVFKELFKMGAENLRGMQQEEEFDEGNMEEIRDITIEDVERPRQILTPPDDAYDASATDPNLDELLEEFGNELLDITMVDKEQDCNPTRDIEDLEILLAKDPQSYFMEIKVHSVIVNTNEASDVTLMRILF